MRDIPTSLAAKIATTGTRPLYLVEVYLTSPLYHSTGSLARSGGKTYNSVGTRVLSVSPEEARLGFNNSDLSASALFLGQDIRDVRCRILKTYKPIDGVALFVPAFYALAPASWTGEISTATAFTESYVYPPVVVFDGTLDSVESVDGKELVVGCLGNRTEAAWAPRMFVGPPLCNHTVPVDTKIGPSDLLDWLKNG